MRKDSARYHVKSDQRKMLVFILGTHSSYLMQISATWERRAQAITSINTRSSES